MMLCNRSFRDMLHQAAKNFRLQGRFRLLTHWWGWSVEIGWRTPCKVRSHAGWEVVSPHRASLRAIPIWRWALTSQEVGTWHSNCEQTGTFVDSSQYIRPRKKNRRRSGKFERIATCSHSHLDCIPSGPSMGPSGPFLMLGGPCMGPPIMGPLLCIIWRGILLICGIPGIGPLIWGMGPRSIFLDPGEPKLGGPLGPLASPLADGGACAPMGGGGGGAPADGAFGGRVP